MGWKTIVAVIFAAVALRRIWQITFVMQPWKVVYNHSPGPCHLVPPIGNGSEDIQLLPNGKALISSGLKMAMMTINERMMNSPGQFYLFDFNSPQEGGRVVPCTNFPDYGTKNFAPHGLSVLQHKGEVFVFVVNHPPYNSFDKDTVEKFSYDTKSNSLTHLKTYSDPHLRLTNDVVAVGPDSFYVTNMNYNRETPLVLMEWYLFNLYWSTLIYYDNGKAQIVADGVICLNGVNVSPDKKFVYVSPSITSEIRVYERKADGTLEFKQSKPLYTTVCDNIDVEPTTGDLWVGCHPIPAKLSSTERKTRPSQILRIKTKDGLLTDDVTEVYSNDGTEFEASSVAVYHRDSSAMLVGSVDLEMLYCKVNYLS